MDSFDEWGNELNGRNSSTPRVPNALKALVQTCGADGDWIRPECERRISLGYPIPCPGR